MEQTTQTTGTNPTTVAEAPKPQSMAERVAEYSKIPGLFDDSPKAPPAPPAAVPPTQTQQPDPAKDDTDEVPADIKSESAKANWKTLRTQKKEYEAKAKDWETKWKSANDELEKFKAAPKSAVDPAEIEALKKENSEISERLRLVDIERHPKFKAYFDQKSDSVAAEIKQIGGAEYGDKLVDVMKLPESGYKTAQLEDIYSKLPMVKQGQLASALRDWDKISIERNNELAKARTEYDKIQSYQKEQAQKAQQEQRGRLDQALERQLGEAQKAIHLFQKRDGDDSWNKAVDERISNTKTILKNGLNEESLTRSLIWSQVAPELIKESLADKQRIAALEKELADRKATVPKPGSGDSPTTTASAPANMNAIDRIVWQAQQAGAVR